ncbi:FAD/NAD(P)-binding protein [Pedobacter sp. AW1-32]|uniref:FAD/NAD(P)-binding protein n=1 Tax=Pedobacter sp. AW1-32 TaxID=3383026 RepID=UPI003FF1216C
MNNHYKSNILNNSNQRIAILGGGPSGLFMLKRFIESGLRGISIDIFERKNTLGMGMPYSLEGANEEHITNVSDNEIPRIVEHIQDWVYKAPEAVLSRFNIVPEKFNEYKVLPRLFFGEYLSAQFAELRDQAEELGIPVQIHLQSNVLDVKDDPEHKQIRVCIEGEADVFFDRVIVCTGHNWPKKNEDKVAGYFDSPYPPKKLAKAVNHPVGIKGASLTAIDAVRTLARNNGHFYEGNDGELYYALHEASSAFKLVMHSRNGLLPAIRFHLEDSHLGKDETLSRQEIDDFARKNGGFVSLDYLFEHNFKQLFIEKRPEFFEQIKDLTIEEFVDAMMHYREKGDPFELFKKEYAEAEKSIAQRTSIYWKEVLAVLSFTMNYPAKYLPAEDMIRLQKVLMPLISLVIAFVPQSSCRELMALNNAGILTLVAVGEDSEIVPQPNGGVNYVYTSESGENITQHFETFVDCVGQPHLSIDDFPFKSLINQGAISSATLRFKNQDFGRSEMEKGNKKVKQNDEGVYVLSVPGITINDYFEVVDEKGEANNRIYILAVPYIGGFNPDYSGIDFCEAASASVIDRLLQTEKKQKI